VSAAAALVAFAVAVFAFAGATGASTTQIAAFVVSGITILIGIAAGLVAALATAGSRKRGLRWALGNFLVGLVCAALLLMAGINNMNP
jgi:hypothetical protein